MSKDNVASIMKIIAAGASDDPLHPSVLLDHTPTVAKVTLTLEHVQTLRKNLTPVHRPVTRNAAFLEMVELIKSTGTIPGLVSIAYVDGVGWSASDANHRLAAALETGLTEFVADLRNLKSLTVEQFAKEYLAANSTIKTQTRGDIIRAEAQLDSDLMDFMAAHPWLTFENSKRQDTVPVQLLLSAGRLALVDNPSSSSRPKGAKSELESLGWLTDFANLCQQAWPLTTKGNRLYYNTLNLGLTAWLYLRIVPNTFLSEYQLSKRVTKVTPEVFLRCMQRVTSDQNYADWLPGRTLAERSRREAYNRLKALFTTQIKVVSDIKNPALPQPEWSRQSVRLGKL